jgi:toluene monooxygenase system ferredoxin subunit
MAFEAAMTLDDLWSGEMSACTIRNQRVLLINVDGEIHAYADFCPHMRTPLSKGMLDGATLTCATHGWVFDVRSGRGINPAQACLTEFATSIAGNDIFVDVEQASEMRPTCSSREKSL